MSRRDILRKIRIPERLTLELAEIIGIHIGDGSACKLKDTKTRRNGASLTYTFNNPNDIEYYNSYVSLLFRKVFGIEPTIQNCGNWFEAKLHSKAIFSYLTKTIGLPVGKKSSIVSIPKILNEYPIQFKLRCIRGIADTDSALTFKKKHKKVHYYPVLKFGLASKDLINDIETILKIIGLKVHKELDVKNHHKNNNKTYTKHWVYISGKKNLELWMKLVGFKNYNYLSKYIIWKKIGFYPPRLTMKERESILNGRINPERFYN